MENTNNHESFPNNIFPPQIIEGYMDGYKWSYTMYKARFRNLYELYEYLKSDPEINRTIFKQLSSEKGDRSFAGKPYAEAVEDLISPIDPGYEEFLALQKNIDMGQNVTINKYKTVKTVAGGHLNIPAYSAGAPLCYETEERITKPRFIRIHINLSYAFWIKESQVYNRAVIITNTAKALEKAGYSVDINAFQFVKCGDELVNVIVGIKQHGEKINMTALYKTLCHVEFLRRILFRVQETLAVRNNWESSYGQVCDESVIRNVLGLGKEDIFFSEPSALGINGVDLARDFVVTIRKLNLEDKIDVEKTRKNFMKVTESKEPVTTKKKEKKLVKVKYRNY